MNNNVIKNAHNDDFVVEYPEFETCVICGVVTNVSKSLHIDFRHHYVEGVGQLCFHCYTKPL